MDSTSLTTTDSQHPIYPVALAHGSEIILTPCPGTKGCSVGEALKSLSSLDVSAIVTLMPLSELQHFQVETIGAESKPYQLAWFHIPVADDSYPEAPFEEALLQHKPQLLELLKQGKKIAIHCKGGTGRTGMLAALLMLELGYSWKETLQSIQAVRPKSLTLDVHLTYLQQWRDQMDTVTSVNNRN